MRVLFINSVNGVGSTGKIVEQLAKYIINCGHEACIAYGRGVGKDQSIPTYFIGNKLNNFFHGLNSCMTDGHGFASKKATRELIDFIKKYKPDVVNLHNLHGYYVNIELLLNFLKNAQIPVVCTMHDMWLISGHSAYIEVDEKGNLPHRNTNFLERFEYPSSIFDHSKRNYQKKLALFSNFPNLYIVTPSNWLENIVRKSFLADKKIKTIYNGIDLSMFNETLSEHKENKKTKILAVANIWEARKGLDDILLFEKELSSDDYEFSIVGKTNKKIPQRINYFGQITNGIELAKIYSDSDIFINTSYSDNFPTTIIESQACGTPVITYETGGSSESLIPGTGLSVKTGDKEQFIATIKKFRINSNTSELCRKNSVNYGSDVMGENYLELFKLCLSAITNF